MSGKAKRARRGGGNPPHEGLKVSLVSIDDVLPYARNPRRNDGAVAKVAASIREFGWRQPIVVDETMTVIAGHTRLLAARQLGQTEVPVHVAAGLTPAQVKAYRLADNRTGEEAEWDAELLVLEFGELVAADFDIGLTGFDEIPANPLDPADPANDPGEEWEGMPEFRHEDKTAIRSLVVHFKTEASVLAFAALVQQVITGKTRYLWYPQIEIERLVDKRYAPDS
jgi:hypothetical protein